MAGNRLERGRINIVPWRTATLSCLAKVRLPPNPMIGVIGTAQSTVARLMHTAAILGSKPSPKAPHSSCR
ncbi:MULTISPECIES: hypothetical protein [Eikenella]|uniref:Uncharacterized protein n=1 Tax=Eikenella exigua TaxID=2528037 RepID=A0AAX1F574_9NEIS|nr:MULTISPECIES: hypothetical protein [Eikenella]QED91190.1 hypothetical protein EZJ17_00035 [Eikenella exigua]